MEAGGAGAGGGGGAGAGGGGEAPPWELLGRGSPAGRALFKLYGGDQARTAGARFSQRNRARHSRALERGYVPPKVEPLPEPREAPKVSVPKFVRRSPLASVSSREIAYLTMPTKKKVDQGAPFEPDVPVPRRPALDDREKRRFAKYMEWNGKPPERRAREPPPRREAREKSELEVLEELFAAVTGEVEERGEFLRQMGARGDRQYEAQVRAEVSARVAELRKIDGMIRGLEEAGRGGTSREDYSGEPSAAGSEGLS